MEFENLNLQVPARQFLAVCRFAAPLTTHMTLTSSQVYVFSLTLSRFSQYDQVSFSK